MKNDFSNSAVYANLNSMKKLIENRLKEITGFNDLSEVDESKISERDLVEYNNLYKLERDLRSANSFYKHECVTGEFVKLND